MQAEEEIIPWYKQPLVWMLIAIPGSAVVAGIVTIYIAVVTDDGLVADDYYKQGLAINERLGRETNAQELGLSASTSIDTTTGYVEVVFEKGKLMSYPDQLQFSLKHASQSKKDISIQLQHGIGERYVGNIITENQSGVSEGVWHVELSNMPDDSAKDWRLLRRATLRGKTVVKLDTD